MFPFVRRAGRSGSVAVALTPALTPALAAALAVAMALTLPTACATGPGSAAGAYPPLATRFADRTPEHVNDTDLAPVVAIVNLRARTQGTATIIAPDHLLTAAHMTRTTPTDVEQTVPLRVAGEEVAVTVVASGDPETPHGDWVILRAAAPRWTAIAPIHAPARAANWRPEVGNEVLLVGYAAGFFEDQRVDHTARAPSIPATIRDTDPGARHWFAAGGHFELGGMSGGPAMLWNAKTERLEVIGVFRGYVPTEVGSTTTTRFLGIPISTATQVRPGLAYTIHRLPGSALDALPFGVPR